MFVNILLSLKNVLQWFTVSATIMVGNIFSCAWHLITLKSDRFSALQFKLKLKWINYTARRFEKRTIKLSHFLTELDLAQNSLKLWLIDTGQKPASDIGVGLTESRLKNLDDERHNITSANMKPVQITLKNTNVKLNYNTINKYEGTVQPKWKFF